MPLFRLNHRRLVMPLLILGVAAALGLWSTKNDAQKMADVQHHIQQLCEDAAPGRLPADRLNNSNATVAEQTVAAIKEACDSAGSIANLTVAVTPGDIAQIGRGQATHTAMIRVNGRDVLGLRVHYPQRGTPIEILGYWRP